jgi:hypothetical protein
MPDRAVGAAQSRTVVRTGAAPQGRVAVVRPGGTYYRSSYYRPSYYYRPAYYPHYYARGYAYPYYPVYGFGVGFGIGYGFGVGVGYSAYPYGYYPYSYPYPYYGYPVSYSGYYGASLRLQVSPRETEVFLDGYYAGTVDEFDGVFQRLNVQPGNHELEFYHPGRRTVQQSVLLQPGKTANVKLAMQPLAAGEPEPARPVGNAPPPPEGEGPAEIAPGRSYGGGGPRENSVTVEAPPPNGAGYGSLSLRVQPGAADIRIDGERWAAPGVDERMVVQLSTGRHVIQIENEGYRRYTTEVTVRSGETSALNVALTKQ